MPELRCSCGRRYDYDVVSGKFKEINIGEQTILKIRCSVKTKNLFQKLKAEYDLDNYESLLQLLMGLSSL